LPCIDNEKQGVFRGVLSLLDTLNPLKHMLDQHNFPIPPLECE